MNESDLVNTSALPWSQTHVRNLHSCPKDPLTNQTTPNTTSFDPFSAASQDPLSEFRDYRQTNSNTPQISGGDWTNLPLGPNHGQLPYRSSSPFPMSYTHAQQRHSPSRSHSLSLPQHPLPGQADRNMIAHSHPHSTSHWPTATPQGYNYTEEPKSYPPLQMGSGMP